MSQTRDGDMSTCCASTPSTSFKSSRILVKVTSKNIKIFIAGKREVVFIESHPMNIVIKTRVGRPRVTSLSQIIGQSLNVEPVFRVSFYGDYLSSFLDNL